ncbi:MAG: ABC transporter ATP-binding protein [Acidilobus sp.]
MGSGESLYEVEGLTKVFSTGFFRTTRIYALNNIAFDVREGEVLSIVGESGSGKSTLLKILLKVEKPTSGTVLYRGAPLEDWDNRRYWKEVQAILQDPYSSFNPFYRVSRPLYMAAKTYMPEASEADRLKAIREALDFVGLDPNEVLYKYPHQLSGGQLQRLMIARALVIRPRVLLADEPVSMIDASLRANILNLLFKLKTEQGMSVLFVTHDLSLASYIADRILVLYKGEIMEYGDVEAVYSRPSHPYSQLLMKSIPLVTKKWTGRVTTTTIEFKTGYIRGCVFADRCPIARDICKGMKPALKEVEPGHSVSCHYAAESAKSWKGA